MLQLYRRCKQGPVTAPTIASAEGLSVAYVEKLLRILSQGNLVDSVRGARGGFVPSQEASDITLGDVMRALGDLPDPNQICAQHTGGLDVCTHDGACSVRPIWSHVARYLDALFDSIPLSSLVEGDQQQVERLLPAAAYKRRAVISH